jgi:hypothetical protein
MSTVRIQVRRGTEAQWAQVNPILAAGEVGLESDTNYFKFGTGSVAWNALPYANEPLSDLENRVGAYLEDNLLGQANGVASLNSLGKVPVTQLDITELSQDAVNTAITAGTGITKLYDDVANTITVSTDTSVIATKLYAESYTDQAFAQLVGAAPAVLNTLSELSDALGDDANFASTVATALTAKADASVVQGALTAIDTKAPLNSPTFTGGVVLPSTTTIGNVSEAEIGYVNGVTSNLQVQLDAKAPSAGPIFTGSVTLPATTSIGDVSNTEIGYVNGVTSAIQVQLDSKAPTEGAIFTGSVTLPATTSIGDVSNTEIGYVNGVTSGIQAQIDLKAPLASPVFTGTVGGITKGMVGLSNVDDTTDAAKPISTATQTALDLKANAGDLTTHAADETNVHGIANTADLATKAYADSAVSTHTLDTTSVHGIADTADLATKSYADTAEADAITAAGTAADTKISTAVAALTKSSVGLANVDNTSDASKPVSTATQTALDAKAPIAAPSFTGNANFESNVTIEGNLIVEGTTTTVNTSEVQINDPLFYLAANQYDTNTRDIGITGAYGTVGGTEASHLHTGLVKDVTDGKWKLFSNTPHPVNNVVDFTSAAYDTLKLGSLEATTVTPSSGIVFSDGTQTKEGVPSRTVIIEKTAAFNLSDADYRDDMLEVNHTGGSAVTITVPADGTNGITYPVGTSIDILRTNTGAVTIAGSGATVNATPGLTLRARWSSATLFKRAANTWVLMGDLTA